MTSDDDDDEGGDSGEGVVGQESGREFEELRRIMITPGRADEVSMEVRQGAAETGGSAVPGE